MKKTSSMVMSKQNMAFQILIAAILIFLGLICLLPFWYIFSLSLSSNAAITAGKVGLLPVELTFGSYQYVMGRAALWKSLGVTFLRELIAVPISIFLLVTAAYPLSLPVGKFKQRGLYVWFFFITMLINGGMIPSYILVNDLHLKNTIWALVLPVAMNVFNMLLVLSFFRQLPYELAEAAYMDGASHYTTLSRVYVPISKPVLATVTLFTLVQHWNSWFDGLIYMKMDNYPLQTYLRSIIISFNFTNLSPQEQQMLAQQSEDGLKAAQMIIGVIPILLVYPFLQKYFVSGITLGSVKG